MTLLSLLAWTSCVEEARAQSPLEVGAIYVTNGSVSPGGGQVVRIRP